MPGLDAFTILGIEDALELHLVRRGEHTIVFLVPDGFAASRRAVGDRRAANLRRQICSSRPSTPERKMRSGAASTALAPTMSLHRRRSPLAQLADERLEAASERQVLQLLAPAVVTIAGVAKSIATSWTEPQSAATVNWRRGRPGAVRPSSRNSIDQRRGARAADAASSTDFASCARPTVCPIVRRRHEHQIFFIAQLPVPCSPIPATSSASGTIAHALRGDAVGGREVAQHRLAADDVAFDDEAHGHDQRGNVAQQLAHDLHSWIVDLAREGHGHVDVASRAAASG
jgi:hypothetical protein